MADKTTRRAFLAAATGVAAVAATPRWACAANDVFPYGVASGDPLADRVIIWTRCAATSRVTWFVSEDPYFSRVVRRGDAECAAANDYTVHVDVDGLDPDTAYWYRFQSGVTTSPIGRTRTLPTPGSAVERLRVGIVTCAEWEFGFFGGYRLVAERDDLDVVLALGDYIYEFGTDYGGIPSPQPGGRTHVPAHEILTLADYRARYAQYHLDAGLRALHARHPVIAIYDDHEVANDWWKDGSQNHTSPDEGDFHARRDAALQAFREWLPVRVDPVDNTRAYRRFQFGNLVDLFMLDERLYRDEQPMNLLVSYFTADPGTDDPNRTLLGATQRQWLLDGLAQSTAAWKVLGNPVSMVPIDVGPALAGAVGAAAAALGQPLPPVPPPVLVDGWDGYNADRQRVLDHVNANQIKDVVVLTGDYHESFAAELPVDRAAYPLDANSVAVEFIAPAITSPGLAETLQQSALPEALTINTVFEANLTASNPWVKYHEGFSNGYGVAEFRADGMQYDFWFVDNRNNPATTSHPASSWKVDRGRSVLTQAAGPLGPRPPRPAAAPGERRPSTPVTPRTGGSQSTALLFGGAAVAALAIRRRVG